MNSVAFLRLIDFKTGFYDADYSNSHKITGCFGNKEMNLEVKK